MKYFLIAIIIALVFLLIRLANKENPIIGEVQERPFFEVTEENKPKNRPDGLPDNAVWRGGVDGGNYFVLPTPTEEEKGIYYAEIYSDSTGNLIYKGRFRHMHSEHSTCEAVDLTRTDNDIFWNGEVLDFGSTGQYLLPIDPNTLDIDPYYFKELQKIDKKRYCDDS